MNRFFAKEIIDNKAYLSEDDAHHLSFVLRAVIGEEFEIADGKGKEYIATLSHIDKKSAELDIIEEVTVDREAKHRYVICQGIPKGSKLDDVVRHITELGASSFIPLITKRIIVKNVSEYNKTERLQRIADEAAKQSKRLVIPTVEKPAKIEDIIKNAPENAIKIIAWEEENETSLKTALASFPKAKDVYIIVGPEGGLDSEEIKLAEGYGWKTVTLGKRILRTETAPLVLLSAAAFALGDLE